MHFHGKMSSKLISLEKEMNTRKSGKDEKEKKKIPKSDLKKRKEKTTDPCMRCGAPLEHEGDLLCKKCDGEVH
jgi:hypothetical protein